jgi:ADP-ribose pyrophosphatase YjhB (NUDIX family)
VQRVAVKHKTERLVSAGGVILRNGPDGTEVVLRGRHARENTPEQWKLPKGRPNDGESLEETAIRKVSEETGLKMRIIAPLKSIEYKFKEGHVLCHKTVYFFLMREADGGSLEQHDHEFDEVRWFPIEEALRRMTYYNEVTVLKEALEHAGEGNAT